MPLRIADRARRCLTHWPAPGETLIARQAPSLRQLAMHVDQPFRSSALVQVVDILRDQQQLARPLRVEPCERPMRGIRPDRPKLRSTGVVEGMHKRRIAPERLGSRDVVHAMTFPKTVRPPERR